MSVRRIQFAWLVNSPYIRGNLRFIRSAVRRGDFDGRTAGRRRKRAALMRQLSLLAEDPDLSARARCAVAQLLLEINNPFASRVVSR
jgi:hypothetical protein